MRNYEAFGLLSPVSRSKSSHRLYTQQHLAALKTASCWDLQSKVSGSIFIATDTCNMCQHSCESVSHVTILDRGDRFLSTHDRDIADAVKRTLEQQGVQLHLQANVLQIADHDDRTSITWADGSQTQHVLEADAILLAAGRVPNTQHLDLAASGIEVDDHGFIKVDEFLRTTVPNIWALGDIK